MATDNNSLATLSERELLFIIIGQNKQIIANLQTLLSAEGADQAALTAQLKSMEDKVVAILDDIEAEVAADTTVVGSVEQLVGNMVQQIQTLTDELKAAGVDTSRLQAVLDTLRANDTRLGALVAANTPAPPVDVPPPTP